MSQKSLIIKWRVYFLLGVFLCFGLLLIARLYFLQIINHEYYLSRADKQHLKTGSNFFDRGNIYFSSKDGSKIAAATLKDGYKIIINPSVIENPDEVFNNLNNLVEIDEADFLHKVSKTGDPYEELATRVQSEIAMQILDKDITGVSLLREKWRFYPGQNLAAHVVGFMAFSEDDLLGQYGLERQYEELLNRKGKKFFSNFFVEIFSNIKSTIFEGNSPKGSVVTTIEPTVQSMLESELTNLSEKFNSKMSGGIIMDPHTGEIISMALDPNFNLNEFNLVDDSAIYKNHMVESVYEMGSIMKPFTVAIGLDTGAIREETTYDDKGFKTLNGSTISNYDKKARGVVDMQQVLSQSLNVGASFIVDQVGNKVFADYMKKLFAEKTKIDLPNESQSLLSNLDSANDIEYATASYGQGIAMSPISITRALAALGNGGYLVEPHLVKEIEYENGFSKTIEKDNKVQIFKADTSERISRMLVRVVDEALAGGDLALKNYSVAAKTGTAQIASGDGKGYYDDKYLHSFFGYFPAYDPKFIVFLYTIEPKGVQYASETLTDPFMAIVKFLINYYEVEPDRFLNFDESPIND